MHTRVTINFNRVKIHPIQNKLAQDDAFWIYNSHSLGIEGLNLPFLLQNFQGISTKPEPVCSVLTSPP